MTNTSQTHQTLEGLISYHTHSIVDTMEFNMNDLGMDIKDAIKATESSCTGGTTTWKNALTILFGMEN